MKPLPSPALLPLLLLLLGPARAARRPAPAPPAAAPAACGSPPERRPAAPGLEFSWILAYVSMRSCHRVLQDKYGEFSPPVYHSDSPINFWCNWTIWAGSRKHIIIYIQGFTTKEDCNKNEDKILFEGVSSLVEDSVVYACWKKEMHVFATFAEAVHVVLLKTYLPNCRDTQFKGKYYIFRNTEEESSSREGLTSETPSSKLPKRDHILQSGVVEDLRDTLGFATTMSLGSPDKPMAVGTSIAVSQREPRTELLETNAPCELDPPWPVAPVPCGQDQGRGTAWGASPTATLDSLGLSLSTSGDIAVDFGYTHKFSSLLSETPLFGTLQGEQPLLRTAGIGLESKQALLHPALQPKDLGDPQFSIKPTHVSDLDLAVPSQDFSPDRGEREEGVDPAMYLGLGMVGLETFKRCPLLSSVADGAASSLVESLMPSLTSRNEVVNGDRSPLLPGRSFSEALPVTEPELRTSVLHDTIFMSVSATGSFRGVNEVKKVLRPTASWDVLKGQPQLSTHSSCVLKLAPTDLRRVGQHGGSVHQVTSLGVKSCCCPSSTRSQLPLAIPLLPAARGRVLSGSELAFSPLGMEMTPMSVCPNPDPVAAELSSSDFTPAVTVPPEQPMELGVSESFAVFTTDAETFAVSQAQELGGLGEEMEPPVPSAFALNGLDGAWTSIAPSALQGGDFKGLLASPSCLSPGVRKLMLDGDGESSWRWEALAPADGVHGGSFPMASAAQQQVLDPQLGMGTPQLEDLVAPSLLLAPVSLPSEPVPQGIWTPEGGQHHKRAELGLPWTVEYFPVRSCHVVLQDEFGLFYPPLHSDIKTNIWCNWTIWAGPQKHILIYIQGFQASEGCDKNQDKMIFQGVLSSVETKVVYACHNRGTLIFATQATAVYVLLLLGSGSISSEYKHFKGQYYVFRDYATVSSSNDTVAPVSDISSKVRHPHDFKEGANGGELGLLEDETELERSLRGGSIEGRGDSEEVLVEPAVARGDTGQNAELPALDIAEAGRQPEPALIPTAPCSTTDFPLEVPSSSAGPSATKILPNLAQTRSSLLAGVAAATRHFHPQVVVMEEPPLNTNVKPSPLYHSPDVTAEDTAMPGERQEDLFDLASVLASLENATALRSQHHPGDVLFEVAIEIKHVNWVPHGGRELRKYLLGSMKSHIQKNLKLSANRVNEIKLKDIRRVGRDNLLLTFWLHLRPEERNLSLVLQSQLQELLSPSAEEERPWLVSLFVEDVNECSLGFCGEAADCFNGVGTYLCRCKEGYEDRSPTRSGTLCIPLPRSGISSFFSHSKMLVGAAVILGLVLLVAVGILCGVARRRRPGRDPCPEELGAQCEEEPEAAVVMELSHLSDCLRLEPFQLKVRARPPDWICRTHAGPSQAYGVFIEQDESL